MTALNSTTKKEGSRKNIAQLLHLFLALPPGVRLVVCRYSQPNQCRVSTVWELPSDLTSCTSPGRQ